MKLKVMLFVAPLTAALLAASLAGCGPFPPSVHPGGLIDRARRGDPEAQFQLGTAMVEGRGIARDPAAGAALLLKAAEQGHARAENDVGVLNEDANSAQAVFWYRKAAEQGLAIAQNNLGRLYARGQGVARDYAAARLWFEKAAAQGDPDAMNNLARIHGEGDGVPPDPVAALAWSYRAEARFKALGQTEPDWAGLNRRSGESEMTAAQIAEARRRSAEAP